MMISGYTVFYFVNWRARHEGVMHFGVFSVTESQYVTCLVYIVTGFFGCDTWEKMQFFGFSMRSLLSVFACVVALLTTVSEYRVVMLSVCVYFFFFFIFFLFFFFFFFFFFSIRNFYRNSKDRTDPGSHKELLHLFVFLTSLTLWSTTGVFTSHPIMFVWIACFIFSGLVHRLIVNDVTHMQSKTYHNLLVCLPFLGLFSLIESLFGIQVFPFSMNSYFVCSILLFWEFSCWFVYVSRVINEICETLNIRLFVIPSNSSPSGSKAKRRKKKKKKLKIEKKKKIEA